MSIDTAAPVSSEYLPFSKFRSLSKNQQDDVIFGHFYRIFADVCRNGEETAKWVRCWQSKCQDSHLNSDDDPLNQKPTMDSCARVARARWKDLGA